MHLFKDVTFIIPVRFDSEDRKLNFFTTIHFLLRNFETNIIVFESGSFSNESLVRSVSRDILYLFEENTSPVFHRTRLLNEMTKKASTNIVVNYDVDVVFNLNQYIEARNVIANGAGFCFPYDGHFYDVPKEFFNFIQSDSPNLVELTRCTLFNPNSFGGALFFDKQKYTEIGLENQNFISWGFEDWERVVRINKLGSQIHRIGGGLLHLTHQRDQNGSGENPFYHHNSVEFRKVEAMTAEELKEYIRTWDWL